MKLALGILMLGLVSVSAAAESAQTDKVGWVGYWGNVAKSEPEGNLQKSIIVILENQQDHSLVATIDAANTEGKRFSLSGGPLTVLSKTEAVARLRKGSYYDKCEVFLKRTEKNGEAFLAMKLSGLDCNSHGAGTSFETVRFPLLMLDLKTMDDYDYCGLKAGKVRDAWCLSRNVTAAFDTAVELMPKASESVRNSLEHKWNRWNSDKDDPRELCANNKNAEACLVKYFEEQASEIKAKTAAEREALKSNLKDFYSVGEAKKADEQISKLEGVYKDQVRNAMANGEKYRSENILELVRLPENGLYVKTKLSFGNGHSCSYFGAFRMNKAGKFVSIFNTNETPDNLGCQISLETDQKTVSLHSETCDYSNWCGARGMISADFPASARKTIKYMGILTKSDDFKNAQKAWSERKSSEFPFTN
jgi:hypothetical protein